MSRNVLKSGKNLIELEFAGCKVNGQDLSELGMLESIAIVNTVKESKATMPWLPPYNFSSRLPRLPSLRSVHFHERYVSLLLNSLNLEKLKKLEVFYSELFVSTREPLPDFKQLEHLHVHAVKDGGNSVFRHFKTMFKNVRKFEVTTSYGSKDTFQIDVNVVDRSAGIVEELLRGRAGTTIKYRICGQGLLTKSEGNCDEYCDRPMIWAFFDVHGETQEICAQCLGPMRCNERELERGASWYKNALTDTFNTYKPTKWNSLDMDHRKKFFRGYLYEYFKPE
jgi:hypothetical protein